MGNCCPRKKKTDSEDEPRPKQKGERKGWRRRRHRAGSSFPNIITVVPEIQHFEGEDLEEDSPNHDTIKPDVTFTEALAIDILSTEPVVHLEKTPQPEGLDNDTTKLDDAEDNQIVPREDNVENTSFCKALVMTPFIIEPNKEAEEVLDETEEDNQAEISQTGEDNVEKTSLSKPRVMTPFILKPKTDDEKELLDETEKQVKNGKSPKFIVLPVMRNPPYNLYCLKQDLEMFQEFGEETYKYKLSREGKFMTAECLRHQTEIGETDRSAMVRHLCQLSTDCELDFEPLCLAINIMDRLLLCTHIDGNSYQLLADTCLLVASKYVDPSIMQVTILSKMLNKQYGLQAINDMEKILLSNISFDLGVPTVSFFLEHHVMQECSITAASEVDIDLISEILNYARAIAKICLADNFFCGCPPSMQARYCLSVAHQRLFPGESSTFMNQGDEDGVSVLRDLVSRNEDYLSSLLKCEHGSL